MNQNIVKTSRTDLNIFPESDPLCTSSDDCKILSYVFPTAITIHLLYLTLWYSLQDLPCRSGSQTMENVISIKCSSTLSMMN